MENEYYSKHETISSEYAEHIIRHERLRNEVLGYMIEHDDDPIELLKQFAERLRVLIDCDQVIYRDLEETRIMVNSPAIEHTWSVPIEYCMQCEHFDAHHPMYAGGYTEMSNCQEGWQGIPVYKDCPIKSSLTRIVYCDDAVAGYLAIHYVQKYHEFTEVERTTLEVFTRILSMSLSRYVSKRENRELKLIAEMQKQLRENLDIINALASNYSAVYYVDAESGRIIPYTINKGAEDGITEELARSDRYEDVLAGYVGRYVYGPDREMMLRKGSIENLRERLANGAPRYVTYRGIYEGEVTFCELKYVAAGIENGKIRSFVIGFTHKDAEIMAAYISEKLAAEYISAFMVDLDNDKYRIYRHPDTTDVMDRKDRVWSLAMADFAAECDPEYAELVKNIGSPEFLKKELADVDRREFTYRVSGAAQPWRRGVIQVLDRIGGVPSNVVATFMSIDDYQSKINDQQKQLEAQRSELQKAYNEVNAANLRNELLYEVTNALRWSYEISADDRIISYSYADHAADVVRSDGFEGNPMAWADVVHPDDRAAAIEAFEAAIHDRTGVTPYDSTYRIMGVDGKYVWLKVSGRMHRRADGSGEMYGMSIDISGQMEAQQKRLLGAVPLSSDILTKANIGLWAFEMDEGQPPRMYGDEAMLRLVGLDHQVPPEEMYHAWYDHIDEGSYDLVTDAVAKMMTEHAEVQYPWHHPDGHTMIVRCGGVRNPEYTKGIRIEGTHQDVTQTVHFDEEERARAKQMENDLLMSRLRADSLAFIEDNEPDLNTAIDFFGKRILAISGCDQVIYGDLDGNRIVLNAPGVQDVPPEVCAECPFSRFDCKAFEADGTLLMNDCRLGSHGLKVPAACPAKSSYMQMIYSGGKLVGRLTVHYLNDYHSFTENGIALMKVTGVYLGLMIGRINEKKAELARLEAESSSKAKTEFLFNMSHDIRTPMNAILGYTDIALNHIREPERVGDSLRKIKTSGGHLLSLINDILEMSRIEAGKMEIVNVPVNIYEVTEGIVTMNRALAATKDITFNTAIGALENPYIYADELHTNQIIINLISNAIKYTDPGGTVSYGIDQLCSPVNGIARYRISVRDNGIGMSEEFQKHLFESFSREQSATVSKQEGAGLGLAIVKRIVDLMDGTIGVTSKQGEGSLFTVELPLRVMDAAAIETYESTRDTHVKTEADPELAGKKVLLVEDNEMNREIASELLSETGLILETAADGAVALRRVAEKGTGFYDFILMDIQMPVMNGFEATAEIRKLPGGAAVPIIALSANAFKEDVERSLAAGMNAHVAKPINVAELKETLAEFLK